MRHDLRRRRLPRAARLHLIATLTCALAVAAAGTSHGARAARTPAQAARLHAGSWPLLGIGEDSPWMFSDPRFRWLGVRLAREVLAWDVVDRPAELAWRNTWLLAAHARGVRPLVVFSYDPAHPRYLPPVSRYAAAVRKFMRLYPWIGDYSTWDEENHYLQPTAKHERRAAEYFNFLSSACRRCSVTAADVLDEANMRHWLREFLRYAHRPRLWGLHNYFDLNGGGHQRTTEFLRLVRGDVWFTETGGLVWRYDRGSHRYLVRGEPYATRAATRLLSLVRVSRRITRVYYYQWRVPNPLSWVRRHGRITWDSGLVRPDCGLRPAFAVIARYVGRNPQRHPHARHRGERCV